MPAARGVKRTASKASSASAASVSKNKKKRGPIQLDIPKAPTKRGRVVACGQGDVGQLGLGDVPETTRFKHVTGLGEKIVDVRAGGMHSVALDSDGKVWTFGCNDEGALGRNTSGDTDEGTPKQVKLPRKAIAISAGDSHTCALLDNGDIYLWGAFRDSHGSMGLVIRGREGKSCKEPVQISVGEQAVAVASGGDHLVILTTSGGVYTLGCGEQGQLGRLAQRSASRDARGGFGPLLTPSKVTLKTPISRVWAGYHATFALDANGDKMFAWGLNNYGQLGITGEKRKTAIFSPTECDAFNSVGVRWISASCGQHHSVALDDSGVVYTVGRCEYGRLGLGATSGDAETLTRVPKLEGKRCVCIATGTSNSYAVTDSGEIYAWGMGSEGQLGIGKSEDCLEPSAVSGQAVAGLLAIRVAAGGQHALALLTDPNREDTASPTPEEEPEEEKVEDQPEEEPAAKEEPVSKKKKKAQDDEVSSSSEAKPSASGEHLPEKLNGKDKKETAMEVDETGTTETDSKEKETPKTEENKTEQTDESKPDKVERMEQDAEPPKNEDKPEKSETKTENVEQKTENTEQKTENTEQKTENTEQKTENTEQKPEEKLSTDVEMSEKGTVNGAPEEPEKIKEKVLEESSRPVDPPTATA